MAREKTKKDEELLKKTIAPEEIITDDDSDMPQPETKVYKKYLRVTDKFMRLFGKCVGGLPYDSVIRNKEGDLLWGYGPGKTTSDRVGIVQVAQKPNAQMRLNRGTLFVQTAAQGTKTLKVFDVLGNQLLAQNFNGGQSQVNLADFSRRGTLVVKLVTGNKLLATRTIRIK